MNPCDVTKSHAHVHAFDADVRHGDDDGADGVDGDDDDAHHLDHAPVALVLAAWNCLHGARDELHRCT